MANSPAQTTRNTKEASLKACRTANDRFRNLPDALIHRILSFLPTKEAVATSVLSKRWVSLWTLVPNLDLEDSGCSRINGTQSKIEFVNFVYKVLMLNKSSSVEKFRLRCFPVYGHSSINTWISSVMDRGNLREVDISIVRIPNEDFVKLPKDLFLTKKLKILKLQGQIMVDVPVSVCLPSLRILHLIQVRYANVKSVRWLISGCLSLKELLIDATISHENMVHFNISIPTLNTLYLNLKGNYTNMNLQYRERRVEINTPSLKYLNFSFISQHKYVVETFPCLVEANISIRDDYRIDQIRALKGVKCLKLLGNLQHFSLWYKNFPSFLNLTQLELHGDISWDVVSLFLQNCPRLETLVVHDELFTRWTQWTQPKLVPICFVTSLTMARFEFDECLEEQLVRLEDFEEVEKMIEFFLKYATVLRTMEIDTTDLSPGLKFRFLKKLSLFPRSSKACQLSFS